jgi:MSHA biogenesis protein MshK
VSLIFEALKKLDSEKKAPERGFLVVGGSPTAGERRLRVPVLVLLLAAAGAGGFLAARATRPAPVPPVAQTAPPATAAPATVPRLAPPAPLSPDVQPLTVERPSGVEATAPAPAGAAARATPAAQVPPPLAPAAEAPAFALQAVTEQDGQPVAIVNGQLVRVGDRVDGARVVRIAPEGVELDHDGRRLVLSF